MKPGYVLFAALVVNAAAFAQSPQPYDWPQWQGPNRDAISREPGLLKEWPEEGPPLAWRVQNLGGGDSTPSIAQGRVFGMSNRGADEVVWALDEENGSELWAVRIAPAFAQDKPQSKEGPGCTPTVDGKFLYVEGMAGNVACLKIEDGSLVWSRSLQEDFGGSVPAWSYRESPLVDEEKLIVTPGGKDAVMVALSKATGETIWQAVLPEAPANADAQASSGQGAGGRPGRGFGRGGGGGPQAGAGYSSPIAIDVEGVRQYVQLTAKSLIGVAAADGKLLWRYDRPANRMGINCSTPIFAEGLVFASSAYGTGGGAVTLKKNADGTFAADEAYFVKEMQNHHGGMVVHDGALYGGNGGNGGGFLSCLDFRTGEVLWQERDAQKGSLAMADGLLYLRTEESELLLIEPNREEYVERGRFQQPDRTDVPAWAHPAIANGKLYVRDHDLLLCYDVKAK